MVNELKILILLISLIFLYNCKDKSDKKVKFKTTNSTQIPLVIAHRGGAKLAPENTLASFENAINLGVDMIEIDVHLSKDSEVIVIHDASLDRTTNGTGNIKDLNLSEIRNYDAGNWFHAKFKDEKVPTLCETLEAINGRISLLIEIKDGDERYPGLEQKIIEEVKKHHATNWVVIQSFNKKSVLRIKKLHPKISTFYLMGKNFDNFYSQLTKKIKNGEKINNAFDGIATHHTNLDAQIVKGLKDSGFRIYSYTVNNPKDMSKISSLGIDGIITDSPDILINILQ